MCAVTPTSCPSGQLILCNSYKCAPDWSIKSSLQKQIKMSTGRHCNWSSSNSSGPPLVFSVQLLQVLTLHAPLALEYQRKQLIVLTNPLLNISYYLPQLALLDDILTARWTHSVTAISLAPGLTEVTIFGGSNSPHHVLYPKDIKSTCIAATTIMTFGELNPCPHCV